MLNIIKTTAIHLIQSKIKFKVTLFLGIILLFTSGSTHAAYFYDTEIDRLLACYQTELRKLSNGQDKFDLVFSKVPEKRWYKLFIDKSRLTNPQRGELNTYYKEPHLLFDIKEPGYHDAMLGAFKSLRDRIGKRVTIKSIMDLHDAAVSNVSSKGKPMSKGFGGNYYYGLVPRLYSLAIDPQALQELIQSRVLFDENATVSDQFGTDASYSCSSREAFTVPNIIYSLTKFSDFLANLERREGGAFIIQSVSHKHFKNLGIYEPLFVHYYDSIEKAFTLDSKLAAISEFLRALEVAHFLPDGNQRTYSFLLLDQLLIENGIPPAILELNEMFDGYFTVDDMVKQLRIGIANFLNETAKDQKILLDSQCNGVDLPQFENYLRGPATDYTPYFKVHREKVIGALEAALQRKDPEYTILEQPPLTLAIFLNSTYYTQKLLDLGLDPFISDRHYGAPSEPSYELARRFGSLEVVNLLLDYHASKKAEDSQFRGLKIFRTLDFEVDYLKANAHFIGGHENDARRLLALITKLINLADLSDLAISNADELAVLFPTEAGREQIKEVLRQRRESLITPTTGAQESQ